MKQKKVIFFIPYYSRYLKLKLNCSSIQKYYPITPSVANSNHTYTRDITGANGFVPPYYRYLHGVLLTVNTYLK